ncbi:MAG: dTMP kinase [Rhodospirillaceae bacterium]|nr:dTMP kinase [Rhodospirillaceae bacterium]|tara:strand:- start:1513 stop:2136 length:624 start_codon:yes stop_codon:yes gene_type:complete
MRSHFITFEGGEGTGKSTQIKILADYLTAQGQDIVTTREPGGVDNAEKIRELLLREVENDWDGVTEVLLHYAARQEHVKKLILPTIKRGGWILCDRFTDSTIAYQGYGSGINEELISFIDQKILNGLRPDLTFIFDLSYEKSVQRLKSRCSSDRYENMNKEYHERLRKGFLNIAQREPDRCIIIDAENEIDLVAKKIRTIINTRMNL